MTQAKFDNIADTVYSAQYASITKDAEKYADELVCDVLSGLNTHGELVADIQSEFWDAFESRNLGYDASTYAVQQDAGGNFENGDLNDGNLSYGQDGENDNSKSDLLEQKEEGVELGRLDNTGEGKEFNTVGVLGPQEQTKQHTPRYHRIHRSGVSANIRNSSDRTAEQTAIKTVEEAYKGRMRTSGCAIHPLP